MKGKLKGCLHNPQWSKDIYYEKKEGVFFNAKTFNIIEIVYEGGLDDNNEKVHWITFRETYKQEQKEDDVKEFSLGADKEIDVEAFWSVKSFFDNFNEVEKYTDKIKEKEIK